MMRMGMVIIIICFCFFLFAQKDYILVAIWYKVNKHFVQTLSGEFVRVSHIPPTEEKDNLKFPSKCCNRQNSIYNNNSKNQHLL